MVWKSLWNRLQLQFGELQKPTTVRRFLLTKCCESSYLTLVFITLPRTDWLMIVTEINKVVRKCVCWVRLGSSIWNVLWLWNTNKDFKSKFI